jgi:DNA modification methylase
MEIKATSIVMVPINKIIPNDKNNNIHTEEQKRYARKIFDYQGFRAPLLISNRTGKLVAGHLRLEIAKEKGVKELPCMFQDFDSEEQEYAHLTADNALAAQSSLDFGQINTDILELGPFDIELLGIKDFVIEPIEKLEPQCDEDKVPEVVHPITRKGDLWLLGNHRLLCGDSTMLDDVEKLMNGEKADVVFTSPPYNANTKAGDGDIFTSKKSKKLYGEGYHDNRGSTEYVDFAATVLGNCFNVTNGFIFWNVSYNANSRSEYIRQIVPYLDFLIEQVCWRKTSSIPFKGSLMRDWEPVFVFSTSGEMLGLEEVTSNHWQISNQNSQQENHKACFPVGLPEKGIGLISKQTGVVFEPFCGSGTTIIASEKLDRKCYGMELDEKYCDIIINRWQNYTGKKATLELTGQTYEELKLERDNQLLKS